MTSTQLDVKRSRWYHTTFVIMAEVMGAGVLGLPYATSRLGLVLGSTVSLVFGVAATYSGLLLARARHDFGLHEANSYSDLAQALGGPLAGRLTVGVVLVAWGSLLPYFLLACADSINLALAPDWNLPLWQNARLVVFLLLLPLQLRTLHNLSYLAVPSTMCAHANPRPAPPCQPHLLALHLFAAPLSSPSSLYSLRSPPRPRRRRERSPHCSAH